MFSMLLSVLLAAPAAHAYTYVGQPFLQEEIKQGTKLMRRKAIIHTIDCTSAGENGFKGYYIYEYKDPAGGYRAIAPPNWSVALGGKDVPTFQEAAHAACTSEVRPGTQAPGGPGGGPAGGRGPGGGGRGPGGGSKPGDYLGCYKDSGDRDLNGYIEYTATNTPEQCVATCQAHGFAYAAVQYGGNCMCGDSYGKYGPADNCDMQCSGNANEKCGGGWANDVYVAGRPG
jgi:hypothetical protein